MRIVIKGQPPRTTHQSGTRYSKWGTYKTPALKAAEQYFRDGLLLHKLQKPMEGPIRLHCEWRFKTSKKAELGMYKTTRPDTDNMMKTVKDVMTDMGFWEDDSQVCQESCTKIWSSDPGVTIDFEPLPDRKDNVYEID
jgi:Holliday junction resolvase RusA-like endonuclease